MFNGNLSAQVNFTAPELLGRITERSATINVETASNLEYYYEYGSESGVYDNRLPPSGHQTAMSNEPFEIIIDGLVSNTRYYYRLIYSTDGGNNWIARDEHTFHTQRALNSTFLFTVTSDSHQGTLSSNPSRNLYHQTLSNVSDDNPDLHFDVGDTFAMTNLEPGETEEVKAEYLSQRASFGIISNATPIYLIIGNHEEEEGWNLDDAGADIISSKPIMSTNARKEYFLNPIPDEFFSGNSDNSQLEIEGDHLREDYFAFEWGDALFVGIEPYWNTTTKPFAGTGGGEQDDEIVGNRWDWTLGEDQYLWFKQTLESSNAKWKFVFSHQVAGGTVDYGRGGAEATSDYEWGASDAEFSQNRPDWIFSTSIHQLMLDNYVSIFFHGHDHVFAKEEIDGMVYQECPQPSDISYGNGFGEYENGDSTVVVNNSGHIRVAVSSSELIVDYIRAYLPGQGTNGSLGHSYSLSPTPSGIINDSPLINDFYLYQNYPNPFNPSTTIRYGIPEDSHVSLVIYDVRGQVVQTLESNRRAAGNYTIVWNGETANGNSISTGIYFARLVAGDYTQVIKLGYLK